MKSKNKRKFERNFPKTSSVLKTLEGVKGFRICFTKVNNHRVMVIDGYLFPIDDSLISSIIEGWDYGWDAWAWAYADLANKYPEIASLIRDEYGHPRQNPIEVDSNRSFLYR